MKEHKALQKGSVYRIFQPYRGQTFLLCFLTVLESLLQVTFAVLTRFVIDAAVSGTQQIWLWGTLLVADSLLMVGTYLLISWFSGSAGDQIGAKLRKRMLLSVLYSKENRLQEYHSGEMLNRGMEDVRTVCDGVIHAFPSLVGQLTRLVATFLAVFIIYDKLAILLFAVGAAVICMAALVRPVLKKNHRKVRQTDEKVTAAMQEDLQQLTLIQSLSAQKQILSRFVRRQKDNLAAKRKRRIWSVGSNGFIVGASQLGSCALLLWGAFQVAAGTISYGSLTSMLQLLSLFRGPVLSLSGTWTRLSTVEVAAERLQGLLSEPELTETDLLECNPQAIVFEDVTFAYQGEEAPVLQNFSARFSVDGWTCLTGISGKGKSTLFKLILGLYTPQDGRVYLETDQGEIPCSENTRSLFAYVPQDYALFSGTVWENMQLVAPELNRRQLENALSFAQADFIWEMEQQEHTGIGENNTGLSMGQIQRLAIARAVLMDRKVFLLDECTSALDAETEKAVLQGLKGLGKNAIVVTHRPEALQDAEKVNFISID